MEPTTPNSAATEHANDDNTELRGGDATERAATTEVMTTPAFDAATCDIAIGPCRLRCMKNEHGILCKMQDEIGRRFRVPVALQQLQDRLLQSIGQMVRYYAKIAMTLITVSFAMLQDILSWLTPLESAACFHLANAYMHQDLYTRCCEANHCWIMEVIEPSAPETATAALALHILTLSATDWHVPRWLPCHELLCKMLTAVCMHTLQTDYACTTMAFLLPTFGKRPQEEGGAARKRTATMSPATEQTLGTPTDTNSTMQNPQNDPPMQASSSAAESDAATEHIAARAETTMSMHAIVVEFSVFSTDNARDLVKAAQAIIKGNQEDVRNLCKPWGVRLKAQKHYRPMETIKQELKTVLTKRAVKLKNEAEPYVGSAATEHAETEKVCDHRPSVSIQEGRFADIASFMRPMHP